VWRRSGILSHPEDRLNDGTATASEGAGKRPGAERQAADSRDGHFGQDRGLDLHDHHRIDGRGWVHPLQPGGGRAGRSDRQLRGYRHPDPRPPGPRHLALQIGHLRGASRPDQGCARELPGLVAGPMRRGARPRGAARIARGVPRAARQDQRLRSQAQEAEPAPARGRGDHEISSGVSVVVTTTIDSGIGTAAALLEAVVERSADLVVP